MIDVLNNNVSQSHIILAPSFKSLHGMLSRPVALVNVVLFGDRYFLKSSVCSFPNFFAARLGPMRYKVFIENIGNFSWPCKFFGVVVYFPDSSRLLRVRPVNSLIDSMTILKLSCCKLLSLDLK